MAIFFLIGLQNQTCLLNEHVLCSSCLNGFIRYILKKHSAVLKQVLTNTRTQTHTENSADLF